MGYARETVDKEQGGMTITITLNNGCEVIIDDEDAPLAQYRWQASHAERFDHRAAYARRTPTRGKQKTYVLHREILKRMLGRDLARNEYVDHIDGNPLNCVRDNLRVATPYQNAINVRRHRDNQSGFKGVSKSHSKWMANIRVDGIKKYLGTFETPEEAHAAYCRAAEKHHGEFAKFE